jgi:hypothetical protein
MVAHAINERMARVRLLEGLLRITAVAFPPVPTVYHLPAGPFEVSRFPCMRPM